MTISQICICLAIAVYLIAMLGVGVWFSKRNNSVDDFYLGGRKLGPFVTAMSAEASDMSSWLLMGLPGVAYLSGLLAAEMGVNVTQARRAGLLHDIGKYSAVSWIQMIRTNCMSGSMPQSCQRDIGDTGCPFRICWS